MEGQSCRASAHARSARRPRPRRRTAISANSFATDSKARSVRQLVKGLTDARQALFRQAGNATCARNARPSAHSRKQGARRPAWTWFAQALRCSCSCCTCSSSFSQARLARASTRERAQAVQRRVICSCNAAFPHLHSLSIKKSIWRSRWQMSMLRMQSIKDANSCYGDALYSESKSGVMSWQSYKGEVVRKVESNYNLTNR